MTSTFLDMDRRQTITASSVDAADQLRPQRRLRAAWSPIETRCFHAAAEYVAADQQFDDQTNSRPRDAEALYVQTTQHLSDAVRLIDDFYTANQAALEFAATQAAAAPRRADQVVAEANLRLTDVRDRYAEYAHYPTVRSAVAALDSALKNLSAARSVNQLAPVNAAADAVATHTQALERVLSDAPSRVLQAQRTLASVTTRLDAMQTRVERLRPTYSALLREFNVASSKDLVGNEAESVVRIGEAKKALDAGGARLAAGDPEGALELATSARSHLADAESLVDAVTDRLTALRDVRSDPTSKIAHVRFRLRDAQQLAVGRGLTAEWGSVLDAQIDRIDRIEASLIGRHPDYWTFVVNLDQVSAFIAGIVRRMKGQGESS